MVTEGCWLPQPPLLLGCWVANGLSSCSHPAFDPRGATLQLRFRSCLRLCRPRCWTSSARARWRRARRAASPRCALAAPDASHACCLQLPLGGDAAASQSAAARWWPACCVACFGSHAGTLACSVCTLPPLTSCPALLPAVLSFRPLAPTPATWTILERTSRSRSWTRPATRCACDTGVLQSWQGCTLMCTGEVY